MKKALFLCLLAAALMPLPAEKPRRYFEIGIDGNMAGANNYLQLSDFFNKDRVVVIEPGKMPDAGFWIGTTDNVDVFLNLNFGEKFGLGFFTGLEVAGYGNVSVEFFRLLAEGNENMRDFTGTLSAGASVFVDAGLATRFKFGKLTLGVTPAAYVPAMYVPPPEMRYHLDTGEGVKAGVAINMSAYTPLSLEDYLDTGSEDDSSGGASASSGRKEFSFTMNDVWHILEAWGLDLSLSAEYNFRPKLDFGGSITNLPLYAATLRHGLNYQFNYTIDPFKDKSLSDLLNGDGFDLDTPEMPDPVFSDDLSFSVFRPLRFDYYLLYRPLATHLIVLKPDIGFSALTVFGYEADKICFNAGLEAQLNLKRMFTLSLATGYREKIWRHNLGFMLNFRVIELDLGVALQSQDFVGSFLIKGAGVYAGVRLGF
jgi:hypothetical protein